MPLFQNLSVNANEYRKWKILTDDDWCLMMTDDISDDERDDERDDEYDDESDDESDDENYDESGDESFFLPPVHSIY